MWASALLLTLPSASILWRWGSTSTSWGCPLHNAPSQTSAGLKFLSKCFFSTWKWSKPLCSKATSFQRSWFFMKIAKQHGNLNAEMILPNVQWWHWRGRHLFWVVILSIVPHVHMFRSPERQEYARPRICNLLSSLSISVHSYLVCFLIAICYSSRIDLPWFLLNISPCIYTLLIFHNDK